MKESMNDKGTSWRNMYRYSDSIFSTKRESPKEATSVNHDLLIRGGFVKQEMAGVYTYTPLGLKVIRNIERVIREEMDGLAAQEVLMPSLHPKDNWVKTGRWDSVDVLFKLKSRYNRGREYALGCSHEEIATPLVQDSIRTYRDLPLAIYQIQTKFRDEKRAKSGLIRGREFGMKDMYSFHSSQEDLAAFYASTMDAYLSIFKRCGIDAVVTEASGGDFSDKKSHEFMALSDAGEDLVQVCSDCSYARNIEVADGHDLNCPDCNSQLETHKAVEVGNIFDLGARYCEAFDITFADENGDKQYPVMGCYGVGTTRLMGTVVEAHHDENGIIWPKEIAPYDCHVVGIGLTNEEVRNEAASLVESLTQSGYSVLFDDREDEAPGSKFATADLIGIPTRIVISPKTVKNGYIEVKSRGFLDSVNIEYSNLSAHLQDKDKTNG